MENNIWLANIRAVIEEFSSGEFQERVWLKGLGPEVSSYEEAMCKLFDDFGFSRLIDAEWRQSGLSEAKMLKLRDFRTKILEFDRDVPEIPKPEYVLGRSTWPSVRECAAEAVQALANGSSNVHNQAGL